MAPNGQTQIFAPWADPAAKPLIEFRNVSKRFGNFTAIDNLNLSIYEREFFALLGPSGCGKTTLMRLLAGFEPLSAGTILLDGQDISPIPPNLRAVNMMFQSYALFPHLSVGDNVGFGVNGGRDVKRAAAETLLEKVGLRHRIDQYPHALSGGEQQRVALARALAPKPRIMLMDEPFSGLDNRLRDGVRDETLAILKSEDTAVLLVTHEPEEAMRMADEIALMRAGRIVQSGAPYNIYNAPVDRAAVAVFSDANVIKSRVTGALAETPFGQFFAPGLSDGTKVDIVVRPQHVRIDFDRQGKGPNPTPSQGVAALGHVIRSRFLGSESLVEFRMAYDGSVLKASIPSVFLPKPEQPMWLTIPRDRCFIFEATR